MTKPTITNYHGTRVTHRKAQVQVVFLDKRRQRSHPGELDIYLCTCKSSYYVILSMWRPWSRRLRTDYSRPLSRTQSPAASIWFEIWGLWIRVNKISTFQANCRGISIFFCSSNFTKKFDFSRQIFEKISFFPGNFRKISIFFRQMFEEFRFLRQFLNIISIFQAKIAHLQLLLGKLFYYFSRVSAFEHTSCT